MNPEVRKEWVEALRSGEYQQTAGILKDANGFCCLGVLCDLHAKKTGGGWYQEFYLDEDAELPYEVREWAEIKSSNPQVVLETTTTLAQLNDAGRSFAEIAAIIEEQL